jgi:N-acyl-D-amino-acid deacylase
MDAGFLITNGMVVDGTGRAPYAADIRVRGGVIDQIGQGLIREGRERVVDASGCFVTPGFVEAHNHFDGPMWWLPTMEPMPSYGVTTSVNGNCGFSAAPVHDDLAVKKEMVDIFSFFEDIPRKPFLDLLPWDWKTWGEYKASMVRNVPLPLNYTAFVGHIAIRLAAMGLDAWNRAATAKEIARMCGLLDDALASGAMGLSSNLLDHDANDRPVPSWKADDAEWSALMDVVERYSGALLQINVDYIIRFNAPESIERIAALARGRKLRIQFTGAIPTLDFTASHIPGAMATFQKLKDEGFDVWNGYNHRPNTTVVNFNSSLYWAQTNNYVWGEVIQARGEEAKFALLADPAWRAKARDSWAQTFDQSPAKYPEKIQLMESESGAGPIGVTLRNYMDAAGIDHPSDALAEWVLDNGVGSILRLTDIPRHAETLMALFRETNAVGNLSDSGAHGQMFCGIGNNIELLTEFVRDKKQLRIEEAIHILTGQPARHFNLHNRGVIAVGAAADIVIFNLDEIEMRPEQKCWDVPDGKGGRTYRLSRAPAPVRLTLVNGIATFDRGGFTGRYPGQYIGPSHGGSQAAA